MPLKTKPFDSAAYLGGQEAIAAYLIEALDTGDPAFVAEVLGVVVRARGMTEVVRHSGVTRESLYRAFSADGNPELTTVLCVLQALKLKLAAVPMAG